MDDIAFPPKRIRQTRLPARMMICPHQQQLFPVLFLAVATLSERNWSTFRKRRSRESVREWLRGLDKDNRKAIGLDLMRVQFGWPIGMPLVRNLTE